MPKKARILFYDKQGAYSSLLKNSLEKYGHRVLFSKRMSDIYDDIVVSGIPRSLIFVFTDERELIELLEVQALDVDIIYAPTNRKIYDTIKRARGLESVDLFQNKGEVVLDLLVLIDRLEGKTKST